MDEPLLDFQKDLKRLRKLLDLIARKRAFRSDPKPVPVTPGFLEHACDLHDAINECHTDLTVLSGSIVLYLGGRFEHYCRERFEQACDTIAAKCATLKNLPIEMQKHLLLLTAEVLKDPRKYGHGDKNVQTFITNLAQNMAGTNGVGSINRQCLSITTGNLGSAMFSDLYTRIGVKDVWKTLAEQAVLRHYLKEPQVDAAKSESMKILDNFMKIRNKIAHPSGDFDWPDATKVNEYIDFFESLSRSLSDVVAMHESTIESTIITGAAALPVTQLPAAEPESGVSVVHPTNPAAMVVN